MHFPALAFRLAPERPERVGGIGSRADGPANYITGREAVPVCGPKHIRIPPVPEAEN